MYNNKSLYKVRVWDLPTRLFHWALVVCVISLAITGTVGGNAMVWHFRFGYSVLALLLFRIIWGLVGGRWSRFGAFIYTPQNVINYLKGQGRPEYGVGHSPIGAGSVFAMLVFLLMQVGSGLFSDDRGIVGRHRGIERCFAGDHGTYAAKMLALDKHRALAVFDGIFRLGKLRGGRSGQGHQCGRGSDTGKSFHVVPRGFL